MHPNQRNANRLKTFKLLGDPSDFCKLFFLSFLEILARALEWSNSCMFGSFTGLGQLGASKGLCTRVWSCIYNKQSINLESRVTESLDVVIACHCWRFTETSYGHFWDRDCAIGHSCETGSSLSVLSELGHLCLVFFLQTTHSGNLFAAFVTLLRKPNETHHKLEKISRSACQKWILSGLRCMSLSGNLEK